MKQYFLILLLILTAQSGFAAARPVDKHGQLHVDSVHIVDQNGKITRLKGISLGWHNWWPQFYNPSVVEELSRNWNISVIRAAMGVEPAGGYLERPEESVKLIQTVVDAAIANGIYVIIDWHSHDIYTEEAEAFFSMMAQQYAGYPHIIYEIFNEPENRGWDEIKEYSIRVIEAIRKYDKHNLIIVGTPDWAQDVETVARDPIVGYENLVYSLHFYAASHELLRYKAAYAVSKGLPMFVSECSPSFANGDGKLDKGKFAVWLDFLKRKEIGFVMWGLYDKEESSAMLKPGANPNGNWPVSQLTEMGVYSRWIVGRKIDSSIYVSIIGALFILGIVVVLMRKKRE
ncbi:glycoside hydrolase family 5 protein [Parabacteroides sp. OttesenSCG-928-G07]|nr:glycoside hydrolase family 5 protein [Parabacteroides sp. OttesenSCG-928-G07]